MPSFAARLTAHLRDAAWLDRDRIVAWCTILFGLEAAFLGFLALLQHGAFGSVPTTSGDFVSFYAAGKLALAGTPALAYDHTTHYLAEQAARGSGAQYQFFFYPPVYLLVCAGLASMPYYVAFAVFEMVPLVPLLLLMRVILRESAFTWIGPVLAFPAVFWTVGLGQNAFLTAALFGGFTLLLDRRPAAAGVLLGLVCYKPHFGLLAPVALMAGRHWRAFGAAAATVAGLIGLSVALFGVDTWRAYLTSFAASQSVYASGRIDFAGIITVFGANRLLGFAVGPSYAIQAVVSLEMVTLVALIWRRDSSLALRSAVLLCATLLAVPIALVYDQLLLLLAMTWLIREARDNGFQPWEKIGLAAIYVLTLATWGAGTAWRLPLGPVSSVLVLLLCVRRTWQAQPALKRRRIA